MTQPEATESAGNEPRPIPVGALAMPYCPGPHDWSAYNLDQIAAMLRRQSPEAGAAATTMWRAIETLCSEQATRLRNALQALAEHWLPTQEASRAFQRWGDSLARAMENTAEVARLNRSVADNISTEIDHARIRIEGLMSDQARYQELEQSHGSLAANASHFGKELLDGDLTFSSWRTTLDHDAREIMADLEEKVYNYALQLYADPPYKPPLFKNIEEVDFNRTTLAVTTDAGWGGGGLAAGAGAWTPHGGFPIPSGGSALGSTPISDSRPGDPTAIDGPGETTLDGVIPDVNRGTPTPTTALPPAPGGGFVDTPLGRVLAPGGVIGTPSGSTGIGTTPGTPGMTTSPSPIGPAPGAAAAARPAGGPGLVPFIPPMVPGRIETTTGTKGGRRSRRGLPSVFDTPDGPPGVIQPPPEPTNHDPGPGVIGIDR